MKQSAGGIIVKEGRVVIVEQKGKTFSFPKGRIENEENALDTAYREIWEEAGFTRDDLILITPIEVYARESTQNSLKEISLFLFTTEKEELLPKDKDNPKAFWVEFDKVSEYIHYKEDIEAFKKAIKKK